MSTKNSYLIKKSWKQRRDGIFKKGDEIRGKFGARVFILIEKDGDNHSYLSHKDGWVKLPPISPGNLSTPNDFITVAQQQKRRPLSQTPESVASGTPEPSGQELFEPRLSELKPKTPPPGSVKSPESRQLLRDYFTGPSFISEDTSDLVEYLA